LTARRWPAGRGSYRLGAEQLVEDRQVQAGDLQGQGGDGDQEHRVGAGAGAGSGAERDGQLGGAEGEERHALPGPVGGVCPDRDAERDCGDDDADADTVLEALALGVLTVAIAPLFTLRRTRRRRPLRRP
jgi:hypothetical protein